MKSRIVHNPVLNVTAVKFVQNAAAFVARKLFPPFRTGEQSSSYYVLDRENALNVPTNINRAPGAPYSRSVMRASDDTYNCKERGHEELVDDRERRKYASALDADKAAINRCMNVIWMNKELRVQKLVTSNLVPRSVISTKWDANGADPIGDVDAIKEVIRKSCGLTANKMTINTDVFNVLKELPVILDKIKYTQRGIVTAELLAAVFGVDELIVAGSVINTANEGQALSPNDVWGDDVILAHVETAPDLQAPNFGRSFEWIGETGPDGVMTESYRDDSRRSDVHRCREDVDEKLVGAECGYCLADALT